MQETYLLHFCCYSKYCNGDGDDDDDDDDGEGRKVEGDEGEENLLAFILVTETEKWGKHNS